ncbi:hypothetical protein KJ959_07460 [bacterium]|nr:hypothetical protein [Candidatus Omnitrophota bacterium]MBU4123501.1 hypothetical protein [bacterium]
MRIKRKFKVAVRRGNTRGFFILLFIIAALASGYLYIRDQELRERILKVKAMSGYSESDKQHIIETIKCGVPISVAEYTLRQEKKRSEALRKNGCSRKKRNKRFSALGLKWKKIIRLSAKRKGFQGRN